MLVVLALLHTIEIKGRTGRVVYADDRLSGSTPTRPNFGGARKDRRRPGPLRVTAHVSRMRWRRSQRGATAAGFWQRARLVRRPRHIERALTDNGACYRSRLWLATLAHTGETPKRTRPYRPQTDGKVEHLHRIPSRRRVSTCRSQ